ncbi:MAG: hypothetical protein HDT30_07770 [Clostridiales bacterium]|nr:hypothetical protein [Clostridiales bacterium]
MSNASILVTGNGFDLYHGLKTSYIDFVRFSEELLKTEKGTKGRNWAISNSFIKCFIEVASENQNWIDCEKEIEVIVTMFLKIMHDKNVFNSVSYVEKNNTSLESYEYDRLKLMDRFCEKTSAQKIKLRDNYFKTYMGIDKNLVMEKLKNDLNDFIKLFKYYLEEKVINQPVTRLSKQIRNINPDYIINFNYTNTYEKYSINRQDVCYVHGSVQEDNIVLGIRDIDEKDIDSIHFKKFFQRIQKHTDAIEWNRFGKNQNLSETMREVTAYFFGHSLSNTDGDLIRSIYENSCEMIIFHLNGQKDYVQKVINLIDTLGKESVIQGMYSEKIKFIPIK